MHKTNISIRERIVFTIACIVAGCVLMLSVHAKDIINYTAVTGVSQLGLHDLSTKAVSELHDHVDKQIVKTVDNSGAGDSYIVNARTKQDLDMLNEEDPGLWGRIRDTFLMWGVFASLPFAVS